MTLVAMKAKTLIELFEKDEHGFRFMEDFASTLDWADSKVLEKAMSYSYD